MKRILIPINPEHIIIYNDRLDNAKVDTPLHPSQEGICCRYAKQITYLQLPALGIIHMNVNYCFVCGRRLHRHSRESAYGGGNPGG